MHIFLPIPKKIDSFIKRRIPFVTKNLIGCKNKKNKLNINNKTQRINKREEQFVICFYFILMSIVRKWNANLFGVIY